MPPTTFLALGFLALVGALAAWWLRRGSVGAADMAGKGLVGLAIGLAAALLVLVPRMEIVPDGGEIVVAIGAAAVALGAFGISWLWLAPR